VPTPVVVLEFNELCPPLIERFTGEGALPKFERLRRESIRFVTEAEESGVRLNPWVQWVTAHTGLSAEDHGVLKLGRGSELRAPTVADAAAEAGLEVWLCSPMNVVPARAESMTFLPDPWAVDAQPHPGELEPFFRFVQANVQEHSNPSVRLTRSQQVGFGWFMIRHGLRMRTVNAVVRQLWAERRQGGVRWRRAALLDRLQWDLFRWYQRRTRPDLATFFSNSTAHLQHHYWRYLEPDLFDGASSDAGPAGEAVRYGYEAMDRLVGEAVASYGARCTIVFCTALSQQPNIGEGGVDSGVFHRPHGLDAFVRALDLDGVVRSSPLMAEQFHLYFDTDDRARATAERLRSVTCEGAPVFEANQHDQQLLVGCTIRGSVADEAQLEIPWLGRTIGFAELLYASETGQSGRHHPDGMFWIRPPGGSEGRDGGRISLRAVAPTLLQLLDVPPALLMGDAVAVLAPAQPLPERP